MPATESSTPLELPKEPVRVALVITGLEVGGAEKCLTQLALNLDRQRFSPEVYSLQPRPALEKASLVDQLEAAGVPVHFLEARSAWSFPRVLWQLRRHLQRQQPHVVQTFLYHANVGGVLASRLAGIRWVFTGLRVADPNPYRIQIERWIYWFAALNLCVSQAVADFYEERGFTAVGANTSDCADNVRGQDLWRLGLYTIPNAVDIASLESAEPADLSSEGIPSERPLILVVGRLHKQKGFDWLAHFLPELLGRLPDYAVVVAGEGPLRDQLLRRMAEHDLTDRVHFLGWRPDVPRLLKRASIVLLPSRYEGMPNVLLEAMAAGVPVVATRAEGVEEILGQSGIRQCTAEFGNTKEMIARCDEIATNPALRRELIASGRSRAEAFSVEEMVRRYEQCWLLATSAESAASTYRANSSPRPDRPAPEADST